MSIFKIFLLLIVFCIFLSTADTLVLQDNLNGYTGTRDTYVESGNYVPEHRKNGTAIFIQVGSD